MKNVLLAQTWAGQNPTGWWLSEKFDGVRAVWDGKKLRTRNGNALSAPAWFTQALPTEIGLDGEVWLGRGRFQEIQGIVSWAASDPRWRQVLYMVFDAPEMPWGFERRQGVVTQVVQRAHVAHVRAASQIKCESAKHFKQIMKVVVDAGGEGLMLRKPGSMYERTRSSTLLKAKKGESMEAVVTGYKPGTGKCRGMVGALFCKLPDGTTFKVGTGFSEEQRKNPPAVGATVTVHCQERSRAGRPRSPSFVGERTDI